MDKKENKALITFWMIKKFLDDNGEVTISKVKGEFLTSHKGH